MTDIALPVPQQLEVQLAKCKKVRKPDYCKSREKSKVELEAMRNSKKNVKK